jgi:Family of unknown function (DUF5677)
MTRLIRTVLSKPVSCNRHANNIVWLATDIICLVQEDRIAGPPILARAMLESVFVLAAATCVPNLAARKAVSELKEWQQRLRKLNMFEAHELADMDAQANEQIHRIQTEYDIDPNDPMWTPTRCARESGIAEFFLRGYFLLSQHTHSSTAGLLTRHSGTDAGLVHQTIISCLVMATGFAAQLFPIKNPQKAVDEAALMLRDLMDLMSRNSFDSGVVT